MGDTLDLFDPCGCQGVSRLVVPPPAPITAPRRTTAPPGIWITLTLSDLQLAAWVAARRNAEALASNRRPAHGLQGNGLEAWGRHGEGACAEVAAARVTNRFWSAHTERFTGGPPDLLPDLEVRYRSRPDYQLYIRDNDVDTYRFVLVRGAAPRF